jgi:hypothetical protein
LLNRVNAASSRVVRSRADDDHNAQINAPFLKVALFKKQLALTQPASNIVVALGIRFAALTRRPTTSQSRLGTPPSRTIQVILNTSVAAKSACPALP